MTGVARVVAKLKRALPPVSARVAEGSGARLQKPGPIFTEGTEMEIDFEKKVRVQAKTLKIHMKVCDEFAAKLCDQDGDVLKDYEGYVPGFMPGQHYGDYVILDIDIDSGQITNWRKLGASDIEEFMTGGAS